MPGAGIPCYPPPGPGKQWEGHVARPPRERTRSLAPRRPSGGTERDPAAPAEVPPDVADLLTRAAALPRGLAFLHAAPLETVAITLRVDARLVLAVRRAIDDPRLHAPIIAAFKEAAARWKGESHPDGFRPLPPPPPCPGPAARVAPAEHPPRGGA